LFVIKNDKLRKTLTVKRSLSRVGFSHIANITFNAFFKANRLSGFSLKILKSLPGRYCLLHLFSDYSFHL